MSIINIVYEVCFFMIIEKETKFLFMTIKYTSQDWKSRHFVNYGKDVGGKTLEYIGIGFIMFSKWKLD